MISVTWKGQSKKKATKGARGALFCRRLVLSEIHASSVFRRPLHCHKDVVIEAKGSEMPGPPGRARGWLGLSWCWKLLQVQSPSGYRWALLDAPALPADPQGMRKVCSWVCLSLLQRGLLLKSLWFVSPVSTES